jgi:hypothetical protein
MIYFHNFKVRSLRLAIGLSGGNYSFDKDLQEEVSIGSRRGEGRGGKAKPACPQESAGYFLYDTGSSIGNIVRVIPGFWGSQNGGKSI